MKVRAECHVSIRGICAAGDPATRVEHTSGYRASEVIDGERRQEKAPNEPNFLGSNCLQYNELTSISSLSLRANEPNFRGLSVPRFLPKSVRNESMREPPKHIVIGRAARFAILLGSVAVVTLL
jgi:hypothetical protein